MFEGYGEPVWFVQHHLSFNCSLMLKVHKSDLTDKSLNFEILQYRVRQVAKLKNRYNQVPHLT